jgi:hypothetical protein
LALPSNDDDADAVSAPATQAAAAAPKDQASSRSRSRSTTTTCQGLLDYNPDTILRQRTGPLNEPRHVTELELTPAELRANAEANFKLQRKAGSTAKGFEKELTAHLVLVEWLLRHEDQIVAEIPINKHTAVVVGTMNLWRDKFSIKATREIREIPARKPVSANGGQRERERERARAVRIKKDDRKRGNVRRDMPIGRCPRSGRVHTIADLLKANAEALSEYTKKIGKRWHIILPPTPELEAPALDLHQPVPVVTAEAAEAAEARVLVFLRERAGPGAPPYYARRRVLATILLGVLSDASVRVRRWNAVLGDTEVYEPVSATQVRRLHSRDTRTYLREADQLPGGHPLAVHMTENGAVLERFLVRVDEGEAGWVSKDEVQYRFADHLMAKL